jgi:hypothetical protein
MLINETVFYRIPETKNKQPEENRRLSAEILVRAGGLGGYGFPKIPRFYESVKCSVWREKPEFVGVSELLNR